MDLSVDSRNRETTDNLRIIKQTKSRKIVGGLLTTPAGWYADPQSSDTLRYWDGSAWTGYTSPAAESVAAEVPRSPSPTHVTEAPTVSYSPSQAASSGKQLFISYARENKDDIDVLVDDLKSLGYTTWLDSSLHGGQPWWDVIMQRIKDSDVFIAVVSQETLNSVACQRELKWADELHKRILPLALGPLPDVLPRPLSTRQAIPYSASARKAALELASALTNLEAAQPLPSPLPEPPEVPLSYLTDLTDQVHQSGPLDHDQQHRILTRLAAGLNSVDLNEQRGSRDLLETLKKRGDLYNDVAQRLAELEASARSTTAGKHEVRGKHKPPHGNDHKPDSDTTEDESRIRVKSFRAPGLNCAKLTKLLERWLQAEGMTTVDRSGGGVFAIECSPAKAARRLMGSGAGMTIALTQQGDDLTVELSNGRWKDKVASFGAGIALGTITGGWGLLMTGPAMVGMYRQGTLPRRVFQYVESVIPECC